MAFAGITDGADAVLDNHYFERDGSVWRCRSCGTTQPFPSPIPADPGPCVPRRWGDEPAPITRPCRCGAKSGEQCFDERTVLRRMERFHDGR